MSSIRDLFGGGLIAISFLWLVTSAMIPADAGPLRLELRIDVTSAAEPGTVCEIVGSITGPRHELLEISRWAGIEEAATVPEESSTPAPALTAVRVCTGDRLPEEEQIVGRVFLGETLRVPDCELSREPSDAPLKATGPATCEFQDMRAPMRLTGEWQLTAPEAD